jgi:hypothetical protein
MAGVYYPFRGPSGDMLIKHTFFEPSGMPHEFVMLNTDQLHLLPNKSGLICTCKSDPVDFLQPSGFFASENMYDNLNVWPKSVERLKQDIARGISFIGYAPALCGLSIEALDKFSYSFSDNYELS